MRKFNSSLNGYNKVEVNNFVNEVTEEYSKMFEKLKQQDTEIQDLKEKIIKYTNMENTLSRALMVADDASKQIKRVAREEANGVLEDAKRNASRIINDALLKANKIEQDADLLKRRVGIFKRRLKSVVDEQIEFIDSINEDY